ncbi:MAG: ATP-binding protein [Patulibacter sp.]|nr:ATP-binding protein [Patulibacter sp.]
MSVIPRRIHPEVLEALADTRVVVILGARQVGKSTLVERIAAETGIKTIVSLDEQAVRVSAENDPTGVINDMALPAIIDEVHRVPDLMLAIKRRVDREQRPGQFLLTGSANILTAPRIADALTGRAEYLRLWPLTQAEIHGTPATLLHQLFAGTAPALSGQPGGRSAYASMIAAGGYPMARLREGKRRSRYFESHVEALLVRDLADIAGVGGPHTTRQLLNAYAAISGALVNHASLGRDLGVNQRTAQARTDLLETLFVIRRLPAYSGNLLNRVVKAPKGYITDSGLLCHLIGADAERIVKDDKVAGMTFETFAVMELLRLAEWGDHALRAFHYRDRDGREVDLVLEHPNGDVIGIEVKAAASIHTSDLTGLRHLRSKLGDRFRGGAVLYTGEATVPFGNGLFAVPLSALWA